MSSKPQPIFVDLNGHTARVDPQKGCASYVRLSLTTEQAYDDGSGEVTHRAQAVEMYITADQADALADVLHKGRAQPHDSQS